LVGRSLLAACVRAYRPPLRRRVAAGAALRRRRALASREEGRPTRPSPRSLRPLHGHRVSLARRAVLLLVHSAVPHRGPLRPCLLRRLADRASAVPAPHYRDRYLRPADLHHAPEHLAFLSSC